MFSVRIVTANHYVASPIKELDATFSDFRRSEVKQVPVIRIFGSTPAGQKTCLHIHGVFPYIYIPYDGTEPLDKYTQQFANSLDLAIQVSLGRASSSIEHVFKVSLVTGILWDYGDDNLQCIWRKTIVQIRVKVKEKDLKYWPWSFWDFIWPLYGYHSNEQQFLKIYFYNPLMVKRAVDLLQTGAVMNKVFQPYEAHIPYILQFLMDYNLYGMNLLNVAAAKFRRREEDKQESSQPLSGSSRHSVNSDDTLNQSTQGSGSSRSSVNRQVWTKDTIPRTQWLSEEVTRQSSCELEADAVAVDILNRLEIEGTVGANPGLVAIWEDEKQRRETLGQLDDLVPPSSPERIDLPVVESELRGKARLQEIIEDHLNKLKEAGCEELTQSLLDEDSQTDNLGSPSQLQGAESPIPSSQIDFHLAQEKDEDGPPMLVREDTEPVVNEDLVYSFLEASQHSSSQKQGSDQELVDLLVDLAHGETQMEEPEEGSILSGQTPKDDDDGIPLAASQVVGGGDEEDDEEGVMDALESLHMSQAWDDGTPNNEMEDGDDDDEEDDREVRDESYDTANSTLEELEDALISITNADEAKASSDLPQYDGPGDEEEPSVLVIDTKTKKRRNAPKPSRYCEDDDFYFVPSFKPKSPRGINKKAQPRKSTKKSNTDTPSTSGAEVGSESPKDKLLKEFVIKITDRFDEEMIKKIPYWNPTLRVIKLSQDSIDMACKKLKGQLGQANKADGTVLVVKQDSLSKGMVKKTLIIKNSKTKTQGLLSQAPPARKNWKSQSRKAPVKKTLGIKRRREPSGDVSDSSNTSTTSHSYGMRQKRERVMYREDDDFDRILELTDATQGDEVDYGDDDDSDADTNWKSRKTHVSPSRYKPALKMLDKSPLSQTSSEGGRRNMIQHRKFISKLSLGRKQQQKEKGILSDMSMETGDDSMPDVIAIEETTSEENEMKEDDDYETLNNEIPSFGTKEAVESDQVSTGSEECGLVSPTLFEDTIISPQSTAEASRGEQDETMGVSSLPERNNGANAARPSQDIGDINNSNSYPLQMGGNSRSRIYSSLSSSPKRDRLSPGQRGCGTHGGKRQIGQSPSRTSSYSSDQWGPPMFSITSDDSKEEYRDSMWMLSYFSPLRPDPEPSPPRAWSPTRPADVTEHNMPWSNGFNGDAKKSSDILTDLACIDSDQIMQEMAEFQRDHGDLFHNFSCSNDENIMDTGESANKGLSADSQTKTKDVAKTSVDLDFEAVSDSQSEEDRTGVAETAKNVSMVRSEPNNNLATVDTKFDEIPLNQTGDTKGSAWTAQHDDDAASKKYEPIKPLEIRGDPSKKVIGTVHPTQHLKPSENVLTRQSSDESDNVLFDMDKSNIETASVKTRTESFSAELKSPLDVEPSPTMLPSSNPMSLMSPTGQPPRFFSVQKLNQDHSSEANNRTNLNNTQLLNTSVLSYEGQSKSCMHEELHNQKEPTDTQQSDSSSPLTPGQRPQESRYSPTPTPKSISDSDDSNGGKSNMSTPVEFDFLSIEDDKMDKTSGETTSKADTMNDLLSTEPASVSEDHSEGNETPGNNVVTPRKTFSSNLMTPVKPTSGDSTLYGSYEEDSCKRSQDGQSEMEQSGDLGWESFSSTNMTPVKIAASCEQTALGSEQSVPTSQDKPSELEQSGDLGWESLSSTDMTPVKTAASCEQTAFSSEQSVLNSQNRQSEMEQSGDLSWESFSSTDMMPVKTAASCEQTALGSEQPVPTSQDKPSELEQSGDLGWESFSSTDMMPVKTAASCEQTALNSEQSVPTSEKEGNNNTASESTKLDGIRDSSLEYSDKDSDDTMKKSFVPVSEMSQITSANDAVVMETRLDAVKDASLEYNSNATDSNNELVKLSLAISETSQVASTNDDVVMGTDLSSKCERVSDSALSSSGTEVCAEKIHVEVDKDSSLSDAHSKSEKTEVSNLEHLQQESDHNDCYKEKDILSEKNFEPLSMPTSTRLSSDAKAEIKSQSESQNAKETPTPTPFQSHTSAFTAIKPKIVPTLSDASRDQTGHEANCESNNSGGISAKRKFEEISDECQDQSHNKSTKITNSQSTQDSVEDDSLDQSHKKSTKLTNTQDQSQYTQDSIEDMSIGGSSIEIPESPENKVENDSDFYTPNGSITESLNNSETETGINGEKSESKEVASHDTNHKEVQNSAVDDNSSKDSYKNGQLSIVALATQLLRPLKPALDPPSMTSVKESLVKHGLHEVQHKKAFWSRPEDQPSLHSRSDILHQTQPKSNVPSELQDIQTKLSDIGLHHWRTVMGTLSNAPTSSQAPNTSFNILHEMSNINYRASMMGETNTVITPCKPPPSKRNVEQWLKQRSAQTMQNKDCVKVAGSGSSKSSEMQTDTFKTPALSGKVGHRTSNKDDASTCKQGDNVAMETDSISRKQKSLPSSNITSTPLPPCFASPVSRNDSLLHSTPVRGPSSQLANEPGLTPIAGQSSQRLRLSMGSQRFGEKGPLANLVRRQSLFFTPRESIGNSQLLRKASDTSQIEGPTPNNTYDFKLSQHNLQDAKALHEVQHLTILSMELHISTRRDYTPDPEADPIRALFFCIQTDSLDGKKQEKGMIVVNDHTNGSNAAGTSGSTSAGNNTNHQAEDHTGIHELSIINVATEKDLLDQVVVLIRKHDPDILVGYEIQQLSWGFLFKRAAFLDMNICAQVSRLPESKKESSYISEKDEYGADHMSEIHLAGRIVLNVWRLMRHEVTLNIYTFENVIFHVLHQRVPKFSFRSLSDWFDHKTNVFRWRVVEYYTLRVCCNLQVLEQHDLIGRTSELARVFGIQFYSVLSRGSQYRVESMMLRLAKPLNYIAASPSQQQKVRMKAPECIALVMEPESRFYHDPVIVLDFQSLYPSMMIAYNYCYSTCLGRLEHIADGGQYVLGCQGLSVAATTLKRLEKSNSLHISPNGVVFVKQDVRHGVLPRMLDQILSTRIMVKKALKDHKDDQILERMLDNRQLGLKLIANVTYGYTGANFSGRMPCIEVADSVVRKGRETLERAIHMVESNAKWGARVVYGDTDSMFILLEGASKDRAFKVGKEIADAVTADNPKPVKLKFEKVYHPCVLQAKKRYVGFKYESPDQQEPVYDAKGIETVRRDGCPAVAKILEKSIKALFTTKDMSQVKDYVQKQFKKIIDGRASMQDLTFAKEYRGRSSYQPGACVPALEISRRMIAADRCSEPRRGERVPYVVVYGSPGLPLIQLVRRPEVVLKDPTLRLNATYYITRQIVPALNRVFSLMGVDTSQWHQELPRNQRVHNQAAGAAHVKKGTIAQYFSSLNCVICDKLTKTGLCDSCREDPQQTATILSQRIQEWNQSWRSLDKVCSSCCGFKDEQPGCSTLDCPVRYKLMRTGAQLQGVPFLQTLLDSLITENGDSRTRVAIEGNSH